MGFKRKLIKLDGFTGELEGLEIVARRMPMDRFLKMTTLGLDRDSAGFTEADRRNMVESREILADVFVSWNIEDENDEGGVTPLPCDLSGLEELDFTTFMIILNKYATELAGVPGPLEAGSIDGSTFPAESIPMETL